jgi:hypothetical protein
MRTPLRVNSHPISVGIPEHMLATYLQVSDLPSQSAHWFGDGRPNCGATWYPGYPGIYEVLPRIWIQIEVHDLTLLSLGHRAN